MGRPGPTDALAPHRPAIWALNKGALGAWSEVWAVTTAVVREGSAWLADRLAGCRPGEAPLLEFRDGAWHWD